MSASGTYSVELNVQAAITLQLVLVTYCSKLIVTFKTKSALMYSDAWTVSHHLRSSPEIFTSLILQEFLQKDSKPLMPLGRFLHGYLAMEEGHLLLGEVEGNINIYTCAVLGDTCTYSITELQLYCSSVFLLNVMAFGIGAAALKYQVLKGESREFSQGNTKHTLSSYLRLQLLYATTGFGGQRVEWMGASLQKPKDII